MARGRWCLLLVFLVFLYILGVSWRVEMVASYSGQTANDLREADSESRGVVEKLSLQISVCLVMSRLSNGGDDARLRSGITMM